MFLRKKKKPNRKLSVTCGPKHQSIHVSRSSCCCRCCVWLYVIKLQDYKYICKKHNPLSFLRTVSSCLCNTSFLVSLGQQQPPSHSCSYVFLFIGLSNVCLRISNRFNIILFSFSCKIQLQFASVELLGKEEILNTVISCTPADKKMAALCL